jgi:hypothetical protein
MSLASEDRRFRSSVRDREVEWVVGLIQINAE